MVSLELVGDLKGQGGPEENVGQGEINHKDDGRGLGVGAKDEEPHGEAISYQVNGSDHHIDGRDGDAGVYIQEQGPGGVV